MSRVGMEDYYLKDWVFARSSNVHIASDRDWFSSYTPFSSYVYDYHPLFPPGELMIVLGIGTVMLDVRVRAGTPNSEASSHCLLGLKNVLHVPSFIVNVVGAPILDNHNFNLEAGTAGLYDLKTHACKGLFNEEPLPHLRLRGHTKDHTSLELDQTYIIKARWPPEERARWEKFQTSESKKAKRNAAALKMEIKQEANVSQATTLMSGVAILDHGATSAIKSPKVKKEDSDDGDAGTQASSSTLKHEDDDKSPIARVTTNTDKMTGPVNSRSTVTPTTKDDDKLDPEDWKQIIQSSPSNRVADYNFTAAQRNWINKKYGHTGGFMAHLGLKPWLDSDLEEAVRVAQTLMEADDDGDGDLQHVVPNSQE